MSRKLTINLRPGEYSMLRWPADHPVPAGLFDAPGLVSITRVGDELSVLCRSEHAPKADRVEPGWRLLTVVGPLEFTLTGIMAALSATLAAAGVAIIALSTFDTDHLLVKQPDVRRALAALAEAGHEVGTVDGN